ncbi:hypothetical protein BNJ_00267 [Kaumoebavirus]|uniref:hypothetical protein n=1 Tax=Kaumoebavirus TaxID=1859492 RepID=UPI0009C2E6FD|nr:hypothetical protein BNJ_00267 [Kaumoebavirus]ARA72091.1 hypothetical protein BNJ_00267 [Kaumoebavirus]
MERMKKRDYIFDVTKGTPIIIKVSSEEVNGKYTTLKLVNQFGQPVKCAMNIETIQAVDEERTRVFKEWLEKKH